MSDDREFQKRSDAALDELYQRLAGAADRYGFEVDSQAGALTVEFDDPPAKFVVSPNSPVHQIWVSALNRSFKLAWDDARGAFAHAESGDSLNDLMASVIGKQLGEPVTL